VTKRYDEPIEVVTDSSGGAAPIGFVWRGRRYEVDLPLTSWREAGQWWNGSGAIEREFHRVLARPAGALATGDVDPDGFMRHAGAVYDLFQDRARGIWRLARIWD